MEHAALCGDRTPIAVQQLGQCHGQCQQPGAHQIVEYPRNPWHPATVWCECGDRWSGGELLPRPFTPGWRQRAQHEFATAWLNAQPAGTRIVRDPDTLEPIATSRKSGVAATSQEQRSNKPLTVQRVWLSSGAQWDEAT